MSRENVETFLGFVEAMNRGGSEEMFGRIAEDVVVVALRSEVEGEYRGHAGIRKLGEDNTENFDVWRIHFPDVRDLGDRVLAIGTLHIRGRGGGVETDVPTAGVASFDVQGNLIRWEDFGDRRLALEAVGLSE
jgi:ketosteroid isomerase-like protein